MGCCGHDQKQEEQKAGGCCGGHGEHKHEPAKADAGAKWWKKLIPGASKKACCGDDKGACH